MKVVPLSNQKKPFEAYLGDDPYVFVSYSHKDKEAVYIELVRLKKLGLNVWYDEGLSPGSRWSDELAERIANCALFIYYVTPNSVESLNCQDEANFVLQAGNPFLAIHLERTQLTPGLALRMGPRQAILRYDIDAEAYQRKSNEAILAHLAQNIRQGFLFEGHCVEPLLGNVTSPDGQTHHLEPKVMNVFVMLAENPGLLMTREQLLDVVWRGQVAADELLTRAVSEIRRALSADNASKSIETVPKNGYRLRGEVQPMAPMFETAKLRDVPPEPNSVESPVARVRHPEPKYLSRKTIAATVLIVVLALGTWLEFRPVSPPHVVESYSQLTNSRIYIPPYSSPNPLVAGAGRMFFNTVGDSWFRIEQLPLGGGEATALELPLPEDAGIAIPMTVTPDDSELLVQSLNDDWTQEFWSWPVVGGEARRIGRARRGAQFSPDGNSLLHIDSSGNIAISDPDLGGARTIVNTNGKASWARFSPDGTRIRFSNDEDLGETFGIFEVNVDGSELRPAFPGFDEEHCCGSWTPDGKYYVFQTGGLGHTQLWAVHERRGILGIRMSEPVQITNTVIDFRRPTISPDGTKTFAVGWQLRGEIAKYDPAVENYLPIEGLEGLSAEWLAYSRDGKSVAYVSYPDRNLWRSNSDGSKKLQLTFPPMQPLAPVWSPDNETIAFEGKMPGQKGGVYVISNDGGDLRRIEATLQGGSYPTWSPNGQTLAFYALKTNEVSGILIYDIESRESRPLEHADGLWEPAWSPSGKLMAARSLTQEGLFLLDMTTGQKTQIASSEDIWIDTYYWGHDDQYLYLNESWLRHDNRWVYRFDTETSEIEKVARAPIVGAVWGADIIWVGVSPDGYPMVLRDLGIHHIYALDWPGE